VIVIGMTGLLLVAWVAFERFRFRGPPAELLGKRVEAEQALPPN